MPWPNLLRRWPLRQRMASLFQALTTMHSTL